jgi:O-antigen/teichoic acid export membrane protein
VVALTCAALAIGAPLALAVFAPPDYDLSGLGTVSALVAASGLLYLWYLTSYNVILWLGRTGVLAFATPVSAGVNIALCALLIPPMGLEGAALATLLAYALLALLTWGKARSLATIPWHPRALAIAVLPVLVVVPLALILPTGGAWLGLRGVAAAALGLAALTLLTASLRASRAAAANESVG